MDLAGFKLFSLISVAFFLMVLCWSCATGQETYPSSGGHHCYYCPKGEYVLEDCKEHFTSPTCEKCPALQFSDEPNKEKHCKSCRGSCPKFSKQVVNCSAETNRKCKCQEGHFKHPLDALDDHWKCRSHTPCGEGEGEIYSGNHTHDTRCQKCGDSQFVNVSDPQHPVCQNCDDAMCGRAQDTTTRTTLTSPPPPTSSSTESGDVIATGAADSDKGALIGGILGGVVCVLFVAVASYLAWKSHLWNATCSKIRKALWIVSISLVVGSVVAIIYVIYKRYRYRKSNADQNAVGNEAAAEPWEISPLQGEEQV